MPFLERMNSKECCIYASRTLLFLKSEKTLKPIAIELSLPNPYNGEELGTVFIPATKDEAGAKWQFAKAHVAANDSVYHQLISHWCVKQCYAFIHACSLPNAIPFNDKANSFY